MIPWVVSADGEMLAKSSECEGGGKVPIKKSELKSQRTDLRLQLQRCSGSEACTGRASVVGRRSEVTRGKKTCETKHPILTFGRKTFSQINYK